MSVPLGEYLKDTDKSPTNITGRDVVGLGSCQTYVFPKGRVQSWRPVNGVFLLD